MSNRGLVFLCAVVTLIALIGAPLLRPAPVLAASGILSTETPLHDSPDPAAPVIALLTEGTIVSIDGPPVDGYYPVTTSGISGWMRGETLLVEKDTPASDAAEATDADLRVDETDVTAPVEAPTELDPAT